MNCSDWKKAAEDAERAWKDESKSETYRHLAYRALCEAKAELELDRRIKVFTPSMPILEKVFVSDGKPKDYINYSG